MSIFSREQKKKMPAASEALPGRAQAMLVSDKHLVLGAPLKGPFPENLQKVLFGMGCFWGVEKLFWQAGGIHTTAVGYSGGYTPNPTYEEVCSGRTGHNEVVLVVYNPELIQFGDLLCLFWENHNPTSGMQQANDVGTQYRSGIYVFSEEQKSLALESKQQYQNKLTKDGGALAITTEILDAKAFYYAEDYHQQYLAKNPGGYCNAQTIGVTGLPSYT